MLVTLVKLVTLAEGTLKLVKLAQGTLKLVQLQGTPKLVKLVKLVIEGTLILVKLVKLVIRRDTFLRRSGSSITRPTR